MKDSIKQRRSQQAHEIKKELVSSNSLPLSQILLNEILRTFIEKYCISFRKRNFSPTRTLWALLSQMIGFLTLQGEKVCSPNTAEYCKPRMKIPVNLLSEITRHMGTENTFPEKLEFREMEILIKKNGFRTKKKIIVTTLLDSKEYP